MLFVLQRAACVEAPKVVEAQMTCPPKSQRRCARPGPDGALCEPGLVELGVEYAFLLNTCACCGQAKADSVGKASAPGGGRLPVRLVRPMSLARPGPRPVDQTAELSWLLLKADPVGKK